MRMRHACQRAIGSHLVQWACRFRHDLGRGSSRRRATGQQARRQRTRQQEAGVVAADTHLLQAVQTQVFNFLEGSFHGEAIG